MPKELCGVRVSDIGLGTWGMGGAQSQDRSKDSIHIDAIKYAIDQGINVIDTAEMYAAGHTEEIVGEAVKGYDREKLFIISKVWSTNLRHDSVLKSAKNSLKRLKTSYIDLYLIHWPNSSIPIRETISAMEELQSDGLVRHIGVSNFNVSLLIDAMNAAKTSEICANQIEYNYERKHAENDIIPFCEKNGVDVIAYTPIMKGRISGYKKLGFMAQKYGASAVQIALRYVMERSLPIPKSSNKAHIDELLKATKINLSAEDYKSLSL